ncbi:MAG TPA: IS110 family transposase [Terriglobia bacterium]|nr:IS110 family transposase [Terriglobia bacterium]
MNAAVIASIGIDLGKTTFHLVALDCHAGVTVRKKFSRSQLLTYTANLPWSLIGMEACSGAHFLAAKLREQGHEVKLIPAQFVKPYRKSNKNDFVDAEAIAEAVTRHNMRFVPIKTDDQLDLQALHRVRERLVRRRTALINQIRGFLLERGLVFAQRPANLRRQLPLVLEGADAKLTPRLRRLLADLWQEWKQVQVDIAALDEEMEQICMGDENCQRLREIPGVGPLVATAIVAAIGNGAAFGNGREFAAWLGLVPRQYSTGGRTRLFSISKRGNAYLRRMFIHGARAVLWRVKYDLGALREWTTQLQSRAAKNVVVVALANKLARIAWAVLSSGERYRLKPAAMAA